MNKISEWRGGRKKRKLLHAIKIQKKLYDFKDKFQDFPTLKKMSEFHFNILSAGNQKNEEKTRVMEVINI